jgi:hypothetical protein
MHGDHWPLNLPCGKLLCSVWWFCACIKASSLPFQQPRSSPVPVLHPSSEDRFLAVHLSSRPYYFFPNSLGWSYVFSFRSLSFCRDVLQVVHCFHIPPCFDILRQCSCGHYSCSRRQWTDSTKRRSASFRRLSLWHRKHRSNPRYFHRCSGRCKRNLFA